MAIETNERKNQIPRVISENLGSIFIFCAIVALLLFPLKEKEAVLKEDFTLKTSKWYESKDEYTDIEVRDGGYYFSYNEEHYYAWAWIPRFKLDTGRDFGIEVRVKSLTDDSSFGYGLIYGTDKELTLVNSFSITNTGYYNIVNMNNSESNDTGWITTQAVRTGKDTNTLLVCKKGGKLHFYINETEVHTMAYKSFFGPWYALRVWSPNTVIFDDLSVYTVKKRPYAAILYKRLFDRFGKKSKP